MRVIELLLVPFLLSLVSGQEERVRNQQQEQVKIPTTLAEAHAELERVLPPETLAEIDAMPSEKDMVQYHIPLGTSLRNSWVSPGSPLAKQMQELGFTHPDGMSSVILVTFWRKRHGEDLRLEELAAIAKKSMTHNWKTEVQKENRLGSQKARTAILSLAVMALLSVALLVGGFVCSILAKTARFKQAVSTSSGGHFLSKAYARLDKIAYALMGLGVLLLLVFLGVLQFQQQFT
jgi:hypothetical protein